MYNKADSEDDHDYSPNELARLSRDHNAKYRQIVESNLELGDSVEKWQQRNRERAAHYLRGRSFPLEGLEGQ